MVSDDNKPRLTLKDRLRQAVQEHKRAAAQGPGSEPSESQQAGRGVMAGTASTTRSTLGALADILGGKWLKTEHGEVFVRDETFPLSHQHGRFTLGDALAFETSPGLFRALLSRPTPTATTSQRMSPRRFGVFDIETTGLSGGTGTYCFLSALGTFSESAFTVRQYFLADLRHERAMLAALAADLEACDVVVTYNGRCFDLPCVETRLQMRRLTSTLRDRADLDLLYPLRRLHSHELSSCRLAETESRLLGFSRPHDTPGSLAPQLYFDYLRAGRIAPLRGVMRHNCDDVLSTLCLLTHVARLLNGDEETPAAALSLARWCELSRDADRAIVHYAAALPALEGTQLWAWAARRYAMLLKRRDRRDRSVELWKKLWQLGDRAAGLELAKHWEHRVRNLAQAESITRDLLAVCDDAERPALEHRLSRVRRKKARLPQTGAGSATSN